MTPLAGERRDVLLRGNIVLMQDPKGYKTSVDAMMLAFFAHRLAPTAPHVLDLGAGSGLVSIAIGKANKRASLLLVELQPTLAERATRNLGLNTLNERAAVICHDIGADHPFDGPTAALVVCNPPYFQPVDRVLPKHPERLAAHYESTADIDRFTTFAESVLAPSGMSAWIYPSADRSRLVDALLAAGLQQVTVHPVEHRPGATPITRVLVSACRAAEPDIRAGSPIPVHPADSDDHLYSDEIEAFIASLRD